MKWNTWHRLVTTMVDKQPPSVAENLTNAMKELKRQSGRTDNFTSNILAQLLTRRRPSTSQ